MRSITDISKNQWKLWLDKNAEWQNDVLYPPSKIDITQLPVNLPTIGWTKLKSQEFKEITLPACVEEFYSEGINDWTYHGVSWYFTELDIPADAKGRRVTLHLEKTRLRSEIYINEKLAGYDLVSETPYEVDITEFVQYGQVNNIAIRITNAGGTRGWNDIASYQWGDNEMMPSHDFSVVGHIKLVITDKTYIEDVFVKNILPACANYLEIITELRSLSNTTSTINVDIIDVLNEECIYSKTYETALSEGKNIFKENISVPNAKLWDIDNPNLYYCKLTLITEEYKDEICVRFGFRVFEVVETNNGNSHFYLNSKRFRHKSAIDWGYYAHTGMYATEEMADKSVRAAKEIGHNGINFHRQIGEPLVLDKADELGLYLYEEPGGIKTGDLSIIARLFMAKNCKLFAIEKNPLAMELFEEKLKRMIIRDRNHPSLLMYTMCNEDKKFTKYRERMLELVNKMDNSRMIINSSGTNCLPLAIEALKSEMAGYSTYRSKDKKAVKICTQYNYRPYAEKVTTDHVDMHTVKAQSRFMEDTLTSHVVEIEKPTRYFGEVACYCGPGNWYEIAEMQKKLPDGRVGYDNNIYEAMHRKIEENYDKWNLQDTCSGAIKTMGDISKQAGRGLMYIDGRLCQTISSYNGADGYAINGWSSGPQVGSNLEKGDRMMMDWDSAIVDEARNLKGPAKDYAYWTRPLQIAIIRNNGKYFKPDQTAEFRVVLINEGKLSAGRYTLNISVIDGAGKEFQLKRNSPLNVEGGHIFSQDLDKQLIPLKDSWLGGHITIKGELYDLSGNAVANGKEQILLDNPKTYERFLDKYKGSVYKWEEATEALKAANAGCTPYTSNEDYNYIAAGDIPDQDQLMSMLKKVEEGTTLVIKFNENWADALLKAGILSAPVTEWGCQQEGFWYGNGWGYLSQFIGEAVPSGSVIGTNGWQPTNDPQGFYPFESKYNQKVYGLWMARHDVMRVLMASIDYGKGKILLNPSYEIKREDILSYIIFYNMLMFK